MSATILRLQPFCCHCTFYGSLCINYSHPGFTMSVCVISKICCLIFMKLCWPFIIKLMVLEDSSNASASGMTHDGVLIPYLIFILVLSLSHEFLDFTVAHTLHKFLCQLEGRLNFSHPQLMHGAILEKKRFQQINICPINY